MQTRFLSYDVIGKNCPCGMTAGNCKLRKELYKLQETYNIGYRVLKNGNLVVPRFCVFGPCGPCEDEFSENNRFRLEEFMRIICDDCYVENRKKEQADPIKYNEQPRIQTVIFAYTQSNVNNCPVNTETDCPVRQELAETERKYHIGYQQLDKDTLLVPHEHYNSKTNYYRNVMKRCNGICFQCASNKICKSL